MSELTVRSPEFGIDGTVPFQWQPANPAFGLFANAFTFLAPAFERYIVTAVRQAQDRFTNAAVGEEADLFLCQEAQHARAHRSHVKAMISAHPDLEETYAAVDDAYNNLLRSEDVAFHLAYIACLEATFTPLFKMLLDHRNQLFVGGDERVGTMLLWHFVEEIEHRNSALRIHHDVTTDRWFRTRAAPKVFAHVTRTYKQILSGFEQHVPLDDRLVSTAAVSPRGMVVGELRARQPIQRPGSRRRSMLAHIPGRDLETMLWRAGKGQLPRHDPGREPLPAWAARWHAAYDAGADVATYAGVGL